MRKRSTGARFNLGEPWDGKLADFCAAHGAPMWRLVLSAAIAAFLCLDLPTMIGNRVAVAFAQASVSSVPTKGSHPHDPLAAADGSIWYTGQMASTLGRLDPKTGAFKEYRTKTPNSGPHGLVADADGNIWFTANSCANRRRRDFHVAYSVR
jgi:streptogramin lyase